MPLTMAPRWPLICPRCEAPLRRGTRALRCRSGHVYAIEGGVADLAPAELPGSTAHFFDSPYGAVYDYGVQHPRVAGAVGRMLWGSDLSGMYSLMDRGVRLPAGKVVLDVPVGGAPVLQRTRSLRPTYIGIDLSAAMLQRAAALCMRRGFDDVTLLRADATALPVADASVDRVLCFNGLHVIPAKRAVVSEFARVLRPGGELWASVLVRPASLTAKLARPWTARGGLFLHLAGPAEIREAGRVAGFSRWQQEQSGAMLLIRARR